MDGLKWKTLLKWMIWGYHHFKKPPYAFSQGQLQLCSADCWTIHRFRAPESNVHQSHWLLDRVIMWLYSMCILCLDDFSSDISIWFPKPSPQKKRKREQFFCSYQVSALIQHTCRFPKPKPLLQLNLKPTGSMYGILPGMFTYIYHKNPTKCR